MIELYCLIFLLVCMGLWGLVIKKELLSMILSYMLVVFSFAISVISISFGFENKRGYFFAIVLVLVTLIEITVALAWCKRSSEVQGGLGKNL